MCGSPCFGRLPVHHQEHTTALEASGLPLDRGGWSVVGRGVAVHDQEHSNRQSPTVKPEDPSAVVCS